MGYRTDRSRAEGLGAANDGVHHWWEQRISAVALLFLTPPFVTAFAVNLGEGHESVLASYAHPFNAIVAIGFFIAVFLHLYQGLQVVIEDYVDNKRWEAVLIVAARLLCALFALIGIFAVVTIALGG